MANLLIPITDTLTPNAFTRTDYKFLCWSTSFSATSATYTDGGQITIIGETTLYAVWQLKFRASKSNVVAGDIAVKQAVKDSAMTATGRPEKVVIIKRMQ